jgi:hypothetical protein
MASHSWTVRAASWLSRFSQTRMSSWISGRRVVPAMNPFYVASMRKDASESPRLIACALWPYCKGKYPKDAMSGTVETLQQSD